MKQKTYESPFRPAIICWDMAFSFGCGMALTRFFILQEWIDLVGAVILAAMPLLTVTVFVLDWQIKRMEKQLGETIDV